MFRTAPLALLALTALLLTPAQPVAADSPSLVLYSGRSKSLVDPLIQAFTKETGIRVQVNYGGSTELALTLLTEGKQSPCDVFWSQEAGALGQLSANGSLRTLPQGILGQVPQRYRSAKGHWIATSGRARVLDYSTDRVKPEELPASVMDLTRPKFAGRVGWAPTNASFQAFVTAMRGEYGEERTRTWLKQMDANGAKRFANNTAIVEAIAAGQVDFGLTNHYYLLRYKKANANYPVTAGRFQPGDLGNLVNVAGAGIMSTSKNKAAAETFIKYLLTPMAQQYVTSDIFEYPVTATAIPPSALLSTEELLQLAPAVDLDGMADLDGTLVLLQEAGLL